MQGDRAGDGAGGGGALQPQPILPRRHDEETAKKIEQLNGNLPCAAEAGVGTQLLALPLELLLNILAHTQCKRSLGRFGCCSRQCKHVCDRGQLVWASMLAHELACGLPDGALRGLPAKEALRRWSTQTSWKWSAQKLTAVTPEGPMPLAPKRFLQRAACVQPPPPLPLPLPRSDLIGDQEHAALTAAPPPPSPKAALLFGGSSQDPRAHHSTYFNDTWQVQLGDLTLRRVEQRAAGAFPNLARSLSAPGTRHENAVAAAAVRGWGHQQIPAPRTAFSLTAVGHRLYLFGGHTLTDGFTNDLWEAEAHFESAVAPAVEQLQSPRKDAAAATVEPIVSFVEWRRLGPKTADRDADHDADGPAAAAGDVAWPKHRQGHSATEMDCGIVLFGGSYPAMALNDTWILEPQTGAGTVDDDARPWFVQVQPDGPVPLPRAGHAAVTVDRRHLLIFGGNTSESTLAPDLWCLDTAAGGARQRFAWSEVAVRGLRPSARIGHSAVVLGQSVLIYGGRNLFQADDDDDDDDDHDAGNEAETGLTCGTVHVLNTATLPMSWSKVEPGGEKPRLRTGHSALAHPLGRGLLIIGGMQPRNEVVLPCDNLCYLDVLGLEEDEDVHAMTPAPA